VSGFETLRRIKRLDEDEILEVGIPADRAFTASEVAVCHVDLKTIHNWVEKGEIIFAPPAAISLPRADM
jgi:hypothetical protein